MSDHFADKKRRVTFSYYVDPMSKGWILISPGPDLDYDIDPERDYDASIAQPSIHLLSIVGTYDPTNGLTSDGDIWRVKH